MKQEPVVVLRSSTDRNHLPSGRRGRQELAYPAQAPVGQLLPDLELVDDDGTVSRLHEHMRAGRGLLLLTPHTRDLARHGAGRVEVVPVTNTEPLLLRPDAVVAWSSGDRASLDLALNTWFGRRLDDAGE
ncbi:hypothetical protein AB0D14_01720 [Streptomyces sp. NPDC048484]|uniref:aromatic-ring hydroxylase C-terminal domain-containing protein n=1 Tax=Streptomyces sp. NPDC048484 TaxID=3155146 RepID=UPI003440E2AA